SQAPWSSEDRRRSLQQIYIRVTAAKSARPRVETMSAAVSLRPAVVAALPPSDHAPARPAKVRAEGLNFYYGATRALTDISLEIGANQVTAFIGPSGCGRSEERRVGKEWRALCSPWPQ